MVGDPVGECRGVVRRGGVNENTWRLVECDEVRVLVKDRQVHRRRQEGGLFPIGDPGGYDIASTYLTLQVRRP